MISLLLLSALLLGNALSQDLCYAPYLQWGQPCLSSKSLYGSPNTYVDYYIDLYNTQDDTPLDSQNDLHNTTIEEVENQSTPQVYCYAYGQASFIPGAQCILGWHYLGQIYNRYAYRLIWGNINSTPAIYCYGTPTGVYLRWSWAYGQSQYGCAYSESGSHERVTEFETMGGDIDEQPQKTSDGRTIQFAHGVVIQEGEPLPKFTLSNS